MKQSLVLLLICFFSISTAQDLNKQQIDSVYQSARDNIKKLKISFQDMVDINLDLVAASEKQAYHHGALRSYIEAGRYLGNQSKYLQSLKTLDKAKRFAEKSRPSILTVLLYAEYGKNYNNMGLYKKALQEFKRAIQEASKIHDASEEFRSILNYIYSCKASVFQAMKMQDSMYSNLIEANRIYKTSIVSARLARYHLLHKNNHTVALNYLVEADKLLLSQYNAHEKSIVLRIYGLYHYTRKNYPLAIEFYEQSIAISNKLGRLTDAVMTAGLLYDVYKTVDDVENQLELLKEYSGLQDRISSEQRRGAELLLYKTAEEEQQKSTFIFYRFLGGAFLLVVLLVIGWYFTYKYYHKKVIKNESLIVKKEIEKIELLQKVNSSFDQLVSLAKENDPNFYILFQELYPDFQRKLLSFQPHLQNSELLLLAYIYLNFETKEIAEYTYKSPRTIQNRKYRLRKKLNISSSDDLSVWLRTQLT